MHLEIKKTADALLTEMPSSKNVKLAPIILETAAKLQQKILHPMKTQLKPNRGDEMKLLMHARLQLELGVYDAVANFNVGRKASQCSHL